MNSREMIQAVVNKAIANGAPVIVGIPACRADVLLSSGRTILHSRMPNGAQRAEPSTGANSMTNAEWEEYCTIVRNS